MICLIEYFNYILKNFGQIFNQVCLDVLELNGIKEENYIVIDCRYSELEFIKQGTYQFIDMLNKIQNGNN